MKTTAAARTQPQTQSDNESREQKMNSVMHKIIVAAAIVGASMLGTESQGATITSANFSLGYGFNRLAVGGVGAWNTLETSSQNTATTLGDFSFVPSLSGLEDTSAGLTFTDRVLATTGTFSTCAYTMNMSLAGSWTGTKPVDAAADPNYRITIDITSIKVWGHSSNPTEGADKIKLTETTSGYEKADYALFAPLHGTMEGGNIQYVENWNQMIWNPTNYATSGTSFTRLLNVLNNSAADVPIDGLEIYGNVVLTYDVIPEPTGLLLLGTGSLLALARRRRQHAN